MKSTLTNLLRLVSLTLGLALAASVANAQSATARTNGDDAKAKGAKSTTDTKKPAKKANAKKTEAVPTSATSGEDAGNYTVTSTIEFGYRGIRTGGDVNKYKSDQKPPARHYACLKTREFIRTTDIVALLQIWIYRESKFGIYIVRDLMLKIE